MSLLFGIVGFIVFMVGFMALIRWLSDPYSSINNRD